MALPVYVPALDEFRKDKDFIGTVHVHCTCVLVLLCLVCLFDHRYLTLRNGIGNVRLNIYGLTIDTPPLV